MIALLVHVISNIGSGTSLTHLSIEYMSLHSSAIDASSYAGLASLQYLSMASCSFPSTFPIGSFFSRCRCLIVVESMSFAEFCFLHYFHAHLISRNLAEVDICGMRFDAYRSLYPVEPTTIVQFSRSILHLPRLKRFIARDVMNGHPSSSCSAAVSAILGLLMAGPSSPHPFLELVDLSGNGRLLYQRGAFFFAPLRWELCLTNIPQALRCHLAYPLCSLACSFCSMGECMPGNIQQLKIVVCFDIQYRCFLTLYFSHSKITSTIDSFISPLIFFPRSSRNGRLDIEISSAAVDVKSRSAAAMALSLARSMLIKRLSNSDAGINFLIPFFHLRSCECIHAISIFKASVMPFWFSVDAVMQKMMCGWTGFADSKEDMRCTYFQSRYQ